MTNRTGTIPRAKRYRCEECGRMEIFRRPLTPAEAEDAWLLRSPRCHPGAPLLAWTGGIVVAWQYVMRQAADGVKLDAWAASFEPEPYWPGTDRAAVGLAIYLARRWRPAEFREGRIPPATTPGGLFG